jgi:MSHA pilin protein MshD
MRRLPKRHRGVTLIELVMFIVLVGIAFGALVLAMNTFTRSSADPLTRKQALAIAESLLDEVELMPFTYCDPDDANASTATSSGACASLPEALGPETQGGTPETRYSTSIPFDNVNDYNGFSMTPVATNGVRDISNAVVSGLGSYSASVQVTTAGTELGIADNTAALRITVTVTPPNGDAIVLQGYRTRYAPQTAQ